MLSRVISRITNVRELIALLISTHEPPSMVVCNLKPESSSAWYFSSTALRFGFTCNLND